MSDAYGRLGTRLQRILVVLPYVIQNPGVTVGELARRFDVDRNDVLDDLRMIAMCGLPGYTPLELIDVSISDDDSVFVGMADYFAAPLRLSPGEALTLYAGAAALTSLPDLADADALHRALAKLGRALGADPEGAEGVRVELEEAPAAHLHTLQRALEERRRVHIEYLSAARGELTERDVNPWALIAALGRWYLVGLDHRSGEERMFRADRIKSVGLLDDEAVPPEDFEPERYRGAFSGSGGEIVTLELSPRVTAWFSEYYPVESSEELADGWHRVRLISGGDHWAATLALRLGTDVRAVAPASVRRHAGRVAAAMIARHQR